LYVDNMFTDSVKEPKSDSSQLSNSSVTEHPGAKLRQVDWVAASH
jgi:hypothetical protein